MNADSLKQNIIMINNEYVFLSYHLGWMNRRRFGLQKGGSQEHISLIHFFRRFHRLTTLIIHHPSHFHSRLKNLPFLQNLPSHRTAFFFFFFFRTDSTDSSDYLPILLTLSISVLLLLPFFPFSCWFLVVD